MEGASHIYSSRGQVGGALVPKTKTGLFSETLEAGGLDSLTRGPWPPRTDHPHLSRPWGLHVPSQRWRVPRPPLAQSPYRR